MRQKLAFASLLVLSGCGVSREAMTAMERMNILENNPQPGISYASISGWGEDVTLKGVELKAPAGVMAAIAPPRDGTGVLDSFRPDAPPVSILKADTMTLKGVTMKNGQPILRDVTLSNVTPGMPVPQTTMSLGAITLEGMSEPVGRFIAGALAQEEGNEPPALEAWAFNKAALAGFKLTGDIPQDEGETGTFTFNLGELSFNDLGGSRLGAFKLAGVKGDVNVPGMPAIAGTYDLGAFTVSGLNVGLFAQQFDAIMSEAQSGEPIDYAALYRNYTSPLEPGMDGFDWTGMKINMSGLKFDTSTISSKITRNEDGVVVGSSSPHFTMTFTADSSSGTLGAMGLMALAMAGYDSNVIQLYGSGDASFDPARDLTRWDSYNIGVSDVFDVKMSGGVIGLKQALPSLMSGIMQAADMIESEIASEAENDPVEPDDEFDDEPRIVPPAPGAENGAEHATPREDDSAEEDGGDENEQDDMFGGASPEMVMSLMMGVLPLQLTDLDIEITDKKLMKLILDRQAITAGQSLDVYRNELAAMISASAVFLADAGVDGAIASELTAAAAGFISGPGTLRIQLKPKSPLGVMSAIATPLTKESLGFSATFTPAPVDAPQTN